jgi:hypothetical protein
MNLTVRDYSEKNRHSRRLVVRERTLFKRNRRSSTRQVRNPQNWHESLGVSARSRCSSPNADCGVRSSPTCFMTCAIDFCNGKRLIPPPPERRSPHTSTSGPTRSSISLNTEKTPIPRVRPQVNFALFRVQMPPPHPRIDGRPLNSEWADVQK